MRKQKAFHQAKLAMRRLRAQAERKRQSDAPIGNSLILAKAALSLIRGGADVDLGWQEEAARTASVLCFDEMQVRWAWVLEVVTSYASTLRDGRCRRA